MGRGSRPSGGSRSSGRTPISGPIGDGVISYDPLENKLDVGISQNEEGKIEGGIGGDIGGGNSSPFPPSGNSPLDPPSGKPKAPGSNIDLDKNQKPNFPDKPKPGAGAGIGVEVFGSPDGNLGVGISVPIGTTGVSARGGVFFDPKTGKPIGGQIGAGVGIPGTPIEATVDAGIDAGGCIRFITIGFGPFSHPFQKNVCKPNEPPKPPGGGGSGGGSTRPGIAYPPGGMPPLDPNCTYHFFVLIKQWQQWRYNFLFNTGFPSYADIWEVNPPVEYGQCFAYISGIQISGNSRTAIIGDGDTVIDNRPESRRAQSYQVGGNICTPQVFENTYLPQYSRLYSGANFEIYPLVLSCNYPKPWPPPLSGPSPSPSPSPSPLPNTPPRKNKKMDDCCQFLANLIAIHGQNISNLLGQEVDLLAQTKKPIFPLEIQRVQTPKDKNNPTKTEKIKFFNYYDLIQYLLQQNINLDVALDPQSYSLIPKGFKMMNPEYRRPTDWTLKDNKEPNQDKRGVDRELKVREKIFFSSALDEMRYIFQAMRRFDYLFPQGELADSQIEEKLLVPGGKRKLRIFNLIHFQEIFLQYLNSTLGDPREEIHVADTNPGKPGSQPLKMTPFSTNHLLREIFKYIVDMEGDGDAQMNLALRDFRTNLANRVQIVQLTEMTKAIFEDLGFVESQEVVKVKLEGDPYAGCWKEGKGFEPSKDLDANTEEATEKLLEATLKNFEASVKVIRRDGKKDPKDLRDVIVELYNKLVELNGGATVNDINAALEQAKFNQSLDSAVLRANVKKAATTGRNRTRRKKK